MKNGILICIFILGTAAQAAEFSHACEASEKWKIELTQKSNWVNRFNVFLQKQESPWLSFSEAVQLKKISNLMKRGEFEADFSEYWVGRIFFDLELYPLAYSFFSSSKETSHFTEIKSAATGCMNEIIKKMPDLNSKMGLSLSIENSRLQKGVEEINNRNYPSAIKAFSDFLAFNSTLGISNQTEYQDLAYLLLGRALYSIGKFNEASQTFQKIDKRSNLEIDAMSDLSWSYLLSEKYAEAIGVAVQLRSGVLKNTFAPESVMVAAMALNETCSYPDAVRMIHSFVHDYQPSFEWLLTSSSKTNHYQEILLGLKHQSSTPIKIRTEWMKSASFMIRQSEINLLIDNSRNISTFPTKIKNFQRDLALKNAAILKELVHDLGVMNIKNTIDKELAQRLLTAKKEIRRVIRFNQASKIMTNVVKKYGATIPSEKSKLVAKINRDLSLKNKDMLSLLKRVRENIDLIEVEVYNGASKEMARVESLKKNPAAIAPQFENILAWNWGRFPASDIDHAEIWEDEMGALKANITNHCQQ